MMRIQIDWVRSVHPRGVQPLAKGTNTLVFATPDPAVVDVFLMCPAKYDWWQQEGIILNPNEDHFFRDVTVSGWLSDRRVIQNHIIRRVQAKTLFRAENGSPQKKEITATIKAMDKIWYSVCAKQWGGSKQQQRHTLWTDFWNEVWCSELPTKELAGFAMNYFVGPDLAARNALVDADGSIVWSDLFCSESVLDFVHMRKSQR
jgi:hypothetical protein